MALINLCWLPQYWFSWKQSSSNTWIQPLLFVSASATHLCVLLQVTPQLLLAPDNQTLAFSVLQAFRIFFMPKPAPWLFTKAARLQLEKEGRLGAFNHTLQAQIIRINWWQYPYTCKDLLNIRGCLGPTRAQHSPLHQTDMVAQDSGTSFILLLQWQSVSQH